LVRFDEGIEPRPQGSAEFIENVEKLYEGKYKLFDCEAFFNTTEAN